ncbi:MAG TPA: hypothetical protein VGB37_13925 [Candidatus Lokiarchaeia archaeon]
MKKFLLNKKAIRDLNFKLLPSEKEEMKIYGNVLISVEEDSFLIPELERLLIRN